MYNDISSVDLSCGIMLFFDRSKKYKQFSRDCRIKLMNIRLKNIYYYINMLQNDKLYLSDLLF